MNNPGHDTCEVVAVACIDFRIQEHVRKWLNETVGAGNYDMVCQAGSVKETSEALKQIAVSVRLHHSKKAILIQHEDCGAYGAEGSRQRLAQDAAHAAEEIRKSFPGLEVQSYFCRLDGTVEPA